MLSINSLPILATSIKAPLPAKISSISGSSLQFKSTSFPKNFNKFLVKSDLFLDLIISSQTNKLWNPSFHFPINKALLFPANKSFLISSLDLSGFLDT